MVIKKKPFERHTLDEDVDLSSGRVITVRLNSEELAELEKLAVVLQQEKLSTVLKQLADIGAIVVNDSVQRGILDVVFNNKRRNERLGIGEVKPDFSQM